MELPLQIDIAAADRMELAANVDEHVAVGGEARGPPRTAAIDEAMYTRARGRIPEVEHAFAAVAEAQAALFPIPRAMRQGHQPAAIRRERHRIAMRLTRLLCRLGQDHLAANRCRGPVDEPDRISMMDQ